MNKKIAFIVGPKSQRKMVRFQVNNCINVTLVENNSEEAFE
jgi:hypothetical protein